MVRGQGAVLQTFGVGEAIRIDGHSDRCLGFDALFSFCVTGDVESVSPG